MAAHDGWLDGGKEIVYDGEALRLSSDAMGFHNGWGTHEHAITSHLFLFFFFCSEFHALLISLVGDGIDGGFHFVDVGREACKDVHQMVRKARLWSEGCRKGLIAGRWRQLGDHRAWIRIRLWVSLRRDGSSSDDQQQFLQWIDCAGGTHLLPL